MYGTSITPHFPPMYPRGWLYCLYGLIHPYWHVQLHGPGAVINYLTEPHGVGEKLVSFCDDLSPGLWWCCGSSIGKCRANSVNKSTPTNILNKLAVKIKWTVPLAVIPRLLALLSMEIYCKYTMTCYYLLCQINSLMCLCQ